MPSASALKAGKAFIELSLLTGPMEKELRTYQARAAKIGQGFTRAGGALLAGGLAIGSAFAAPILAASALEETMNKFNVVFGENAAEVKAWSDNFAAEVGRSQRQIADFMAGTQDLFVPLGFEPGAATDMSKQLTGLAIDLASFNNLQDADVLRDLQSALTGSGEVMKKYGVLVNEAAVKQELLNMGLDPKKATDQQKVAARLNIIMAGTTAAQGDALRSAGSFANQSKALRGTLEDLAGTIGAAVLPVATQFVTWLRSGVQWLGQFVQNHMGLVQAIAIGGAILGGAGAILLSIGIAFKLVAVAAGLAATTIGILGAVFSAVLSPIGLIVAGLGGLVAWFTLATESGQAMTASLGQWIGGLGEIFGTTFAGIKAALSAGDMEAAAAVLWAGLNLLWLQGTASLNQLWQKAWGGLVGFFVSVGGNLERAWSHTIQALGDTFDILAGALAATWETVTYGIQRSWLWLKGIFTDTSDAIAQLDAEHAQKMAEIGQTTVDSIGSRDTAARADRQQSRDAEAAALATVDDGTDQRLAEAAARLDDAKRKLAETSQAAQDAAAAVATQEEKVQETIGTTDEGRKGAAALADGKGPKSTGLFDTRFASQIFGNRSEEIRVLKQIADNTKNTQAGLEAV